MASWKHIIADSGGSKTSWAFCAHDGTVRYCETRGLHPKYALHPDFDWKAVFAELEPFAGSSLYFYGSGCGREATREAMAEKLRAAGFGNAAIFPDTLAACRATCGKEPGVTAILGTGSVLAAYDGKTITNRIGGYGSFIGDEGSGFHFARLVLHDYLDGTGLTDAQRKAVEGAAGTPEMVLQQLASPEAQQWIAQLGEQLSECELDEWHRRNLHAFLQLYLPQVKRAPATMNVVGSYGFHHYRFLSELLPAFGWKPGMAVRNPIEQLVGFHS